MCNKIIKLNFILVIEYYNKSKNFKSFIFSLSTAAIDYNCNITMAKIKLLNPECTRGWLTNIFALLS